MVIFTIFTLTKVMGDDWVLDGFIVCNKVVRVGIKRQCMRSFFKQVGLYCVS